MRKTSAAAVIAGVLLSVSLWPAAIYYYLEQRTETAHTACVQRRDSYDVIHRIIEKAADPEDRGGYYALQGDRPVCSKP